MTVRRIAFYGENSFHISESTAYDSNIYFKMYFALSTFLQNESVRLQSALSEAFNIHERPNCETWHFHKNT